MDIEVLMKRLFATIIAALLSFSVGATTLSPIQLLNPAGSSSGQTVVSTGASTSPAWGNVSATSLAAIAANAVIANVTGASASPTAFSMPSCSTSVSALNWASGTGFTCNTGLITAATAASTYATIAQATTALAATGGSINGITTGLTTPAASKVTTLVATSTITPSSTAGIVGTTTNDNANAGSVGEYVTNSTSGTSLTSGIVANATSASLAAGDWDVQCDAQFIPAGGATLVLITASVNTTSAVQGTIAAGSVSILKATFTASDIQTISSPVVRESLAATTTVFCPAQAGFASGTMTVTGFIRARRPR